MIPYSDNAPVFGNPGTATGRAATVMLHVELVPALATVTGYVPSVLKETVKFVPVGFVITRPGLDQA